jgi:hypothetical protein
MTRSYRILILLIAALLTTGLLLGCGSGKKEGAESPVAPPTRVGSESCVNTCHASTVDITGTPIAQAWENTTHTTVRGVQCEDCHGGASLHHGVGPIPFSRPQAAQCEVCHTDKTGFNATAHANLHLKDGPFGPDVFFFQGDAGTGQATYFGQPEFLPDEVTPVTKAQHIQECSMCHNPNQRFVYDPTTGQLVKPDPNTVFNPNNIDTWEGLQNPQVSCASCHDAHQAEQMVTIPQRSTPVGYPIFRKFLVKPTGEQSFTANPSTGDETPTPGASSVAGFIFQPNGAAMGGTVSGTNNELTVERLCAACHTKSKYLYSQQSTHQTDVYSQWLNSGHGTRNDPAFANFSANPLAYTNPDNPSVPYGTDHAPSYPIDMSLSKFGVTADTTQNAGNDVYACFHCHNGLGSLVWQEDAQGTPDADVIFGDETVMCITCHTPHSQPTGTEFSLRVPVKMTQYIPASGVTMPNIPNGNVFLDNTPIPSIDKTENGTICIFCHQGRESGYTLYWSRLAPGATIAGKSFFNPHYLGTAAMLWGVNAYEYAGKSYSVNEAHQGANCPTCHMDNPTDDNLNGGHTWWPNVATCNECHDSANLGSIATDTTSDNGPASPDVANYRASFDTNNYTGDPGGATLSIAQSIQVLENKVLAVLQTKGLFYDDLSYPYFFADAAHTTNFTSWTPATYRAAFNISYIIKGLPSGADSQVNVPNSSAAVHNYKYTIQLLLDGYEDLTGAPLAGAFRPAGTRPATNYDPQAGGGYSPNQ